jgi:oligopeptide transport system substrate-binding protein
LASSKWRKSGFAIASVSALTFLLAGCGGQPTGSANASAAKAPVEGGSINVDAAGNVKDLDPAKAYDSASENFIAQMYETLVTYKGTTSDIAPKVATSWDITDGGKTYTFHLRSDAKFWNGNPVTAQSFIDEFDRVLTKSVSSPGEMYLDPIVQGATQFFNGKAKSVSGFSAPDDHTLVIHLTQPEPFFLQVLTMPFFSAVDKSYITQVGDAAFDATKAMGSGPFKLDSISSSNIVLVKNKDYWMKDKDGNQIPYLDKITAEFNVDDHMAAMGFESGKVAFLGGLIGLPSSQLPDFEAKPALKSTILTHPGNSIYYLGLNNAMKPFNNPKIRQAVEYAINKDQLKTLESNTVTVANQPLPPGIKGYVNPLPADVNYTYDPAKAKQLLAAAGFANGFKTDLYAPNDADSMKLVNSIQNDLAKVGIQVNIHSMSRATFLTMTEKGNATPMFLRSWWQDFPDPADFLDVLFNSAMAPSTNVTMYKNPDVDKLLNAAQTDMNEADRMQKYSQATIDIMKDAPWVPLYNENFTYAVQSWVHGYYINPSLGDPYQYVWIDQNHSS